MVKKQKYPKELYQVDIQRKEIVELIFLTEANNNYGFYTYYGKQTKYLSLEEEHLKQKRIFLNRFDALEELKRILIIELEDVQKELINEAREENLGGAK